MNRVDEGASCVDDYSSQQVQSIVRVIDAALQVRRRYQFFFWTQSHLQTLVPHQFAVCGAYQRARKQLAFEAFHSIVVPATLLGSFCDAGSALMQHVAQAWIEAGEQALIVDVQAIGGSQAGADRDALLAHGFRELLIHGVARPQRPSEIESLFVLGCVDRHGALQHRQLLDLLLPHMHSAWLRVQATEHALGCPPPGATTVRAAPVDHQITERERQILGWVGEGMSNQQIALTLGISALTVKNHVQKVLRKLGAANRAQAVARAMVLNLLDRTPMLASTDGGR